MAAGDSTFWVSSDSTGMRVRGSPMLLARWDGRFYEVYVADDDRSYYDAVFVGQQVFRRDLLTGHTGFKGAWLALWLAELGAEVHGLSGPPPSEPLLYEQLKNAPVNPTRGSLDRDDFSSGFGLWSGTSFAAPAVAADIAQALSSGAGDLADGRVDRVRAAVESALDWQRS